MRSLTVFAALLSIAGCRCEPPQTDPGVGEIGIVYPLDGLTVTRPSGVYDFRGIAMGVSRTQKVVVKNLGRGTLDLSTLTRTSGDEAFTVQFEPRTLGGSETAEFIATFVAPRTDDVQKTYSAHFTLTAANTGMSPATADIELKGIAVKAECALPDVIDFGGVAVGATATQSLHFQNLTSLDTDGVLGAVTSSNGDHLAFNYGPGWSEGPLLLASGAEKEVTLTFKPTQSQSYSALVQLKAAAHCASTTVQLIGSGVASALECAPVDFGFLPVGLTRSQTTTLTNHSLQDVSVARLTSSTSDFQGSAAVMVPKATRGTGGSLTPGTATVSIEFKPTKLGQLDANVSGATDLSAQPMVACSVTGKGGGPDIELKPSGMLDMGAIPYFASAPQPFFVTRKLTIQNLGSAAIPADVRANLKLGVGGMPGQYFRVTPKNSESLASEICVGIYDAANPDPAARCSNAPGPAYDPQLGLVASGASGLLDVPLRVTPSAANKSMEWDVEVFSNDPDEPVVKLNVKAHSVILPPCTFQVTPSNLQFGLVTPPASKDLSFSIRNTGTASGETCLITHLDLAPGADMAFSLPSGPVDQRTLSPNESLTVLVRAQGHGLATTTLRQVLGAVRFGISSPFTPEKDVLLNASVGLSCLTIAPSDLDFGTVRQGCDSERRVFTVYNTCTTPVTVNGWRMAAAAGQPIGGPNCMNATAPCAEFLLDGPPGFTAGGVIPPAASMPTTFALKYHPIDVGSDTGAFALDITQNGGARTDLVVTLRGTGDTEGRNVDTFAQDPRPKADILFVVDSSCSMFDKQQLLSQNFAAFIQYASNAVPGGVDYQMAVIDSDSNTATGGKLRGDATNPKVLRAGMTNVEALFRAKVRVGTSGSGNEQFSDLAVRALTAPLVNTDNAGFLRPDAVLAVIAVTDAGDQSMLPTSVVTGLLRNIKGAQRPGLFSYNVIGPFSPSHPPDCIYDDYTDIVLHDTLVSEFAGVRGQICNLDWANTLQDVGRTAFGYRDRFFLRSQPDLTAVPPFTVKLATGSGPAVPVPPTDMTGGVVWNYEPMSNSIRFTSAYVPEPGQTLTVEYRVLCR